MVKIIGDHISYEVKDVYHDQTIRRTINKLKPYVSESYIIPDLKEKTILIETNSKREVQNSNNNSNSVPELRPVRQRQAPRRYIEEI